MRIVFYSPNFYPLVGGIETLVKDWAEELVRQGIKITVITSTTSTEPDSQFLFPVYRNIGYLKTWQIMRSSDAIIQFNVSLKGLLPCLLSFRPLIISHHSTNYLVNGSLAKWGRLKYFIANYIAKKNTACSNYVAQYLKKVTVIYSSYNQNIFTKTNFDNRKKDLVFLGRLVSDKGSILILEAMSILQKQHGFFCNFSIIGDGPEKHFLQQKALLLGIENDVYFLGNKQKEELVEILNQHKIMIVPSTWEEPFGIVVLEGLACGCKLIVAKAGGLPEALGNCGWLFEKGNAESLAETILKAHKENEINTNNIITHLSNCSLENIGKQVKELLSNTID